MKYRVFILNTLFIPFDFDKYPRAVVELKRLTVEEAKELLNEADEVISAVGHEGTAKLLSKLLEREIPVNRIQVSLNPMEYWSPTADACLHFVLKTRLPEGVVLTEEELQKLDFWLIMSTIYVTAVIQ